jgi:hypothetical protein
MNNYSLVGHDKGPGIAATVILNLLLDELVKAPLPPRRCEPPVDCRRHCRADGRHQPCRQRRSPRPQQDARPMISLLAKRPLLWELMFYIAILELARLIDG